MSFRYKQELVNDKSKVTSIDTQKPNGKTDAPVHGGHEDFASTTFF